MPRWGWGRQSIDECGQEGTPEKFVETVKGVCQKTVSNDVSEVKDPDVNGCDKLKDNILYSENMGSWSSSENLSDRVKVVGFKSHEEKEVVGATRSGRVELPNIPSTRVSHKTEVAEFRVDSQKSIKMYPSLENSSTSSAVPSWGRSKLLGNFFGKSKVQDHMSEQLDSVEGSIPGPSRTQALKSGSVGHAGQEDCALPSISLEDVSYSEINTKNMVDLDAVNNAENECTEVKTCMRKCSFKQLSTDSDPTGKSNDGLDCGAHCTDPEVSEPTVSVTVPSAPPSEDASEASVSVSFSSWSSHHVGLAPIAESKEQSNLHHGHSPTPQEPHQQQNMPSPYAQASENYFSQDVHKNTLDNQQNIPALPASIVRLIQEQYHHPQETQSQQQNHLAHLSWSSAIQNPIPPVAANLYREHFSQLPVTPQPILPPYSFPVQQHGPAEAFSHAAQPQTSFQNSSTGFSKNLYPLQENLFAKSTHSRQQQLNRERNQGAPPPSTETRCPSTHQSYPRQETQSSDTLADLSSWPASLGHVIPSSVAIHRPAPLQSTAISASSGVLKHAQQSQKKNLSMLSSQLCPQSEPILRRSPSSSDEGLRNQEYKEKLVCIESSFARPLSGFVASQSSQVDSTSLASRPDLEQLIVDAVHRAAQEAYREVNNPINKQPQILKLDRVTSASQTQFEVTTQPHESAYKIDMSLILSQWAAAVAARIPNLAQVEGYVDNTIDGLGAALLSEIENLLLGTFHAPTADDEQMRENPTSLPNVASKSIIPTASVLNYKSAERRDLDFQSHTETRSTANFLPAQSVVLHPSDVLHPSLSVKDQNGTVSATASIQSQLDHTKPYQSVRQMAQKLAGRKDAGASVGQSIDKDIPEVNQALSKFYQFRSPAHRTPQESHVNQSQTSVPNVPQIPQNLADAGRYGVQGVNQNTHLNDPSPETFSCQAQPNNKSSCLSEGTRAKLAHLSQRYQQDDRSIAPTDDLRKLSSTNLSKTPRIMTKIDSQVNLDKVAPFSFNPSGVGKLINAYGPAATTSAGALNPSAGHSAATKSSSPSILSSGGHKRKRSSSRARSVRIITPGISRSQGYVGQRLYPSLDTNSFHALMSPLASRRFRPLSGRTNRDEEDGGTSEMLSSFVEEDAEETTIDDSFAAEPTYNTLVNSSMSSVVAQTSHTQRIANQITEKAFHNSGQSCKPSSSQFLDTAILKNKRQNDTRPYHEIPTSDLCTDQNHARQDQNHSIETNPTKKPSPVVDPSPVKPQRPAPVVPDILAKRRASLLNVAKQKIVSQASKATNPSIIAPSTTAPSQTTPGVKPVPSRPAPPIPPRPTPKTLSKLPEPSNQGFVKRMTNAFDQTARSVSCSPPRTVSRPAPKPPALVSWNNHQQKHQNPNTQGGSHALPTTSNVKVTNPNISTSYTIKTLPKMDNFLPTTPQTSSFRPSSEAQQGHVIRESARVPPRPVLAPTKPGFEQAKHRTSKERKSGQANLGSDTSNSLPPQPKHTELTSLKVLSATPPKRSDFPSLVGQEEEKSTLVARQLKSHTHSLGNDTLSLSSGLVNNPDKFSKPTGSAQSYSSQSYNTTPLPHSVVSAKKENVPTSTSSQRVDLSTPAPNCTAPLLLKEPPTKLGSKKDKKKRALEPAV